MEDGRISYEYGLTYEGLKKAQKDIESRLHSVEEAVNETGSSFDGLSADAAKDLNIVGEAVSAIAKTVGEAMSGIEDEAERADFVIDTISAAIEEIETQSESLGDSGAKEILGSVVEELQKMVTAAEEFKQNELPLDPIPPKAQSARAALREMTEQLVDMKMRGQENTEEYKQLLEQVGNLKDTMMDTQQAIGGMASDTAKLDAVLGAANLTAGGFSAVMGAMNLVGASEDTKQLAEAQKKLQSVIAITTGLQAVQNALQKQSNLMLGIARLKALAAAKAEQIKNAATAKGVVATKAATVAQAAFNMVANANPYVLLAMAIVTVVGALVAFTKGTKENEKQQASLNDELERQLDLLERIEGNYNSLFSITKNKLQNHIDLLKAQGASLKDIRAAEDDLMEAEEENLQQREALYDVENLSKYEDKLRIANGELELANDKLAQAKKESSSVDNSEVIEALQAEVDWRAEEAESARKSYEAIVEISNERADFENRKAIQAAERAAEDRKIQEEAAKHAQDVNDKRLEDEKRYQEELRQAREKAEDLELGNKEDNAATRAEKALLQYTRQIDDANKKAEQARAKGQIELAEEYERQASALNEKMDSEIKEIYETDEKEQAEALSEMLSKYEDFNAKRKRNDEEYAQFVKELTEKRKEENDEAIDAAISEAGKQHIRSTFDIDMAEIDETAYESVEERMEAINKAYDRYISNLREAGTSEAEIAKIERERVEITGRIAELNAKIDDLEGQKMIALNNGDVETVKRLNEEIAKLTEELEGLNKAGEAKGFKQSIKDWAKSLSASDIAGYLDGIAGGLEKIGEVAGNEGLSNAGEAISGIGNAVSNIAQGAASGGWIGAVIAAVGTIAEEVINVIAANEELKSAIRQANLDKWVEDQKRSMETSGIFGDDAVARVNASIQVMNNASEKLKGMYSEMEKQTIDRTRKSSYANPLGFIENSVDTWLEEVQGFNANVLSQENSMFAAFKEGLDKGYKGIENYVLKTQDRSGFANFLGIQDEFGNLKDVVEGLGYDLYDQYGNLNSEALQAVLDTYEDLGAADRKWMEEAMAYSDEYAEAMENIADYLGSLFDSVADDIAEALIDSFETGSDAAEAMGETVSKVGRQMAKDIIKNLIISTYFEGVADDFKQKIAENGMTADTASYIVTSFKSAIQQMEGESDYWNSIVESLSSMWNNAEEASKGLASGLATASQDSIDMLTGQMNAVRVAQLNMNRLMDSVILEIAGFHRDYKDLTADTHRKLDRIVSNTSEQGSLVRGMGIYFN